MYTGSPANSPGVRVVIANVHYLLSTSKKYITDIILASGIPVNRKTVKSSCSPRLCGVRLLSGGI